MPNLTQSQSIKLGKVLEAIMIPMFDSSEYAYNNSDSYENLLTRPDFILFKSGKPVASVAVTNTTSRETWIKKRWRYIDEVAQLKSYFGPSFLTINIFYGNSDVFQTSELKIIQAFFDYTIQASELVQGKELVEIVENRIINNSRDSANTIAASIIGSPEWKAHSVDLLNSITDCISKGGIYAEQNLFKLVWEKEHPNYYQQIQAVQKGTYSRTVTYLRYMYLNSLLVSDDVVGELVTSVKKDLPLSDAAIKECKITDFTMVSRLGKKYIGDMKVKETVSAGFTKKIYEEISEGIFSSDTQRFLLKDIKEPKRIELMVDNTLQCINSQKDLKEALKNSFIDDNFAGLSHKRVWILDVIAAMIDVSIARMNRDYVERYGHVGVANPVENFISKTELVCNRFRNEIELDEFCCNLSNLLFEKISECENGKKDELINSVSNGRKEALALQPYINPLQQYLEIILRRNGLEWTKEPIDCMLGAIEGIPETMKKIREIYQVKIKGHEYWIKCIAGYDGVKDKTREMAARGRLLQYSNPYADKRDVSMIFVYDGKWSDELKQLLSLAGWKAIVPIFEFEDYLKNV